MDTGPVWKGSARSPHSAHCRGVTPEAPGSLHARVNLPSVSSPLASQRFDHFVSVEPERRGPEASLCSKHEEGNSSCSLGNSHLLFHVHCLSPAEPLGQSLHRVILYPMSRPDQVSMDKKPVIPRSLQLVTYHCHPRPPAPFVPDKLGF